MPGPLKLLRLLAVLMAIPLFAVAVTAVAAGATNCDRRGTLDEQLACAAADLGPPLQQLAIAAVLLGLALVVAISLAAAMARANRALLVVIFTPGLYLTNVALIVLVVLHGALAVASLGFIAAAVRVPLVALAFLVVAGGTLFGVLSMIQTSFSIVRRATANVTGRTLSEAQQMVLWNFVHQLAASVGTKPPVHIVAGLEPTFFVTEADVQCLDGRLKGRTLYVSLTFCRILTHTELRAIICHELAHFRGWDTRFSRLFYPIYRGTANSLSTLAGHVGEGISGVALFPAWYILGFFLESFVCAESKISRDRELTADRVAAGVVGEVGVASALVKVHGFSRYWWRAQVLLRDAIALAHAELNLSTMFVDACLENAHSVLLRQDLDEEEPPHPTDSHPPLSTRLRALQLAIPDVATTAFHVLPNRPALSLFASPETLERDLTTLEKAALIESRQVGEGSALR